MRVTVLFDNRENCEVSLSSVAFDTLFKTDDSLLLLELIHTESKNPSIFAVVRDSALSKDIVMMSRSFGVCLSISEGMVMEAKRSSSIPLASDPVAVRPADSDDWEVVEANARFLEHNLLAQVSVLFPDMKFPVWVVPGGKPVFLQVSVPYPLQLWVGTEIAVEARPRLEIPVNEKKGVLVLRVISNKFPGDIHDIDFLMSPVDMESFQGSLLRLESSGTLKFPVNVGAHPGVEQGFILIHPEICSRIGTHEGMRIKVADYPGAPVFTDSVRITTEDTDLEISSIETIFRQFIRDQGGLIAGQGTWVRLLIEHREFFVSLTFPLDSKDSIFFLTPEGDMEISFDLRKRVNERSGSILKGWFCESLLESEIVKFVKPDNYEKIERVGCFKKIINNIHGKIQKWFTCADPQLPYTGGFLITGAKGAGKKSVALASIKDLVNMIISVDCARLCGRKNMEISTLVKNAVKWGISHPPAALLFLGVDNLSDFAISELSDLLHETVRPTRSLIILGTARKDSAKLADIFANLEICSHLNQKDRIALIGMDGINREGENLRDLLNSKVEKSAMTVKNLEIPSLGGGLKNISQELIRMISLPLKFPSLCKGVSLPSGVLLTGPPGCGKTALARFVIEALGISKEEVKGPEILDKYIGASEAGVRAVFERAASKAPCVVFFDEIDALCPKRGSGSGVTDRVVNQLLCYLDGVDSRSHIFVIAATSRPHALDPALTRPGRLDKVYLCDIPNQEEKLDILKTILQRSAHATEIDDHLNVISQALVNASSAADIVGAVNDALIAASYEGREQPSAIDLVKALSNIRSSISDNDMMEYDEIFYKFRKGVSRATAPHDVGTRSVLG